MIKISAVVGSNSIKSTNRDLLLYMQEHFKDLAEIKLIEIKDLPICEKDLTPDLPDTYLKIRESLHECQAILISSPEYDRSPTASLLNFLEWLSLDDQIIVDKQLLLLSASYGGLGGSRAQFMLRQILSHKDLGPKIFKDEFYLSYSKDAFDENKLVNEEKKEELEKIFLAFLNEIKRDTL